MSDSDQAHGSQLARRFRHAGLGAFVGALLGLIVAGSLHTNLLYGVLIGSGAGLLIGFLLGLHGLEFIMYWWPG